MAVPAEAPLDAVAAHGLVAGDDVLDVAGEQVAVVGESVGEGRPVVEDELVLGRTLLDGSFEGVLFVPALEETLFDRRIVRLGSDVRVWRCWTFGVGHLCAFIRGLGVRPE